MPVSGADHSGAPDTRAPDTPVTDTADTRGVLYPARLPTFDRVGAPDDLSSMVSWFWIPQWSLAPGRTSRQNILPFPACNLVVEPDAVLIVGPSTQRTHRDLTGSGWAVGALLRPAALPRSTFRHDLCATPRNPSARPICSNLSLQQ